MEQRGVRSAFAGARRRNAQIFRLIVGIGMGLAAVGLLMASGGLCLTRLLGELLTGVTAADPLTYATVVILLSDPRCWPATCRRAVRRESTR